MGTETGTDSGTQSQPVVSDSECASSRIDSWQKLRSANNLSSFKNKKQDQILNGIWSEGGHSVLRKTRAVNQRKVITS